MLKPYLIAFSGAALLSFSSISVPAQDRAARPASSLKIGEIEGYAQSTTMTPTLWHYSGKITIKSANYDLLAADLKVFFLPQKKGQKGQPAPERATADGGPATGGQVDVHIRRPLESEAYEIRSDHAVYVPDASRPSGGKMDFTGHVKVIMRSDYLAGPSVSTTDHATVLLGQGEDYPQLQTGPAHFIVTPAQQ